MKLLKSIRATLLALSTATVSLRDNAVALFGPPELLWPESVTIQP